MTDAVDIAEPDAEPVSGDPAPAPNPRRWARMTLGVGTVFCLGVVIAWPMSFVSAIFTGMLLNGARPLPQKAALAALLIAILSMAANWFAAQFLMTYPSVFAIAITLVLYQLYLYGARGGHPVILVLVMIGLVLQPVLLQMSRDLAAIVGLWLILNLLIAIVASYLVFDLIRPDEDAAPKQKAEIVLDEDRQALRMTLIVAPFALIFFSVAASNTVTLIFVAMLTPQLSAVSQNAGKASKGLIVANLIGGAGALLANELIVMAPSLPFMCALMICLIGGYAWAMQSSLSWAPVAQTAMNASIVLLGSAMAPIDTEVAGKLSDRILQIVGAVAYILLAFTIVDHYLPNRPRRQERGGGPS
ncbi:MAG: hypothetical protein AAGA32_22380 [Pseudomonadota bacterium]